MINKLKILIDRPEPDEKLDKKLEIILEAAEKRLLSFLPSDIEAAPYELEHIVVELAISRFNRLGNESMTSYSQDGESITFAEDDMAPYMTEIDSWCTKNKETDGTVVFL